MDPSLTLLISDSGQMEGGEGSGFDGAHMKKRRSSAVRRPRPEGGPAAVQRDNGSPPPLSVTSRSGPRSLLLTSDENATGPDGGNRRREFLLNAPSPERATKGSIRLRSEGAAGGSRKSDGSSHAPEGNREKLGKVKLKIRNVLPKPNPDTSPVKPPRPVDSRHQQKHGHLKEGTKDSDRPTSSRDKKARKERSIQETMAHEQADKFQREPTSDPVRKSRRLAKKSVDNEFDEDFGTSNLGTPEDWDGTRESKSKGSGSKKSASRKGKNRSKVYGADNDFVTSRSGKKRSRESADDDNTEEEPTSDSEPDVEDTEQKTTATESPVNIRSEPLTTRRRALQSWMDGSSISTVEFPDGLPPAPSRSKKDKLSEEEMLAKKAEAAQRRRMQVEKATKESEAEAIRKILGIDSEKKKEERKQKERGEKERASRAQNMAANSIRWVMGPTGTVISFPHAVGLPSIFDSKPHSYPPPREKCAGPSCTNDYKYRHSKLNLPLCSLKCYKAVQGNA